MTRKRSLGDEVITLENIFEELSSDFKATYEELHRKLKRESKYKRLKRVGEEQFYNATSESSIEMEHQNTRLCFAKINLLVLEVLKVIDAIILEKFQDNFVKLLKEKVLKAILKLYSKKQNDAQEADENDKTLSPFENPDAKLKEDEKIILDRLKDLSKFCADNLIDIRKQVIEMPLEEAEISATENPEKNVSSEIKGKKLDATNSEIGATENPEKNVSSEIEVKKLDATNSEISATENPKKNVSSENKVKKVDATNSEISATENPEKNASSNADEGNISFESLSSVHTSDLSSFDDEMVFSSDEETGKKAEKMSMEEVVKKLSELKAKKLMAEKEDQTQVKATKNEDKTHPESPVNDPSSIPQKTVPQRVRKPNSKYATDVIQTPLKRLSTEKKSASSSVSSVDHSLPRKRGRPRKHLT